MFKQPQIDPITEEQLLDEVRMIYVCLVMAEKTTSDKLNPRPTCPTLNGKP